MYTTQKEISEELSSFYSFLVFIVYWESVIPFERKIRQNLHNEPDTKKLQGCWSIVTADTNTPQEQVTSNPASHTVEPISNTSTFIFGICGYLYKQLYHSKAGKQTRFMILKTIFNERLKGNDA